MHQQMLNDVKLANCDAKGFNSCWDRSTLGESLAQAANQLQQNQKLIVRYISYSPGSASVSQLTSRLFRVLLCQNENRMSLQL